MINWSQMEKKWRVAWNNAQIYEADPEAMPKFFMTVAYPYPNSPQHVGHGRTYTITDVYARYKRMQGINVLFPMAFHYTGTPILAMAKRIRSDDAELITDFQTIYHVPSEIVKTFTEPLQIAQYFHHEIRQGMQEIGYSIDWRREFTTVDPIYQRFIEWQFHQLQNKALITRGSHPVGWCPSCESPMGQHDTKGDLEPEFEEITLVKFSLINDNIQLPTGTLRPETLFGVTNLWLHPDIEYVSADVNEEEWIMSRECADKLAMLEYTVHIKRTIPGHTLIGKYVKNPLTTQQIIILPAAFVDPNNGTGIVMSVPGHAPYDYIALQDLKKTPQQLTSYNLSLKTINAISPISLIYLEGYSPFPAVDLLQQIGAVDQYDPKVEAATKEVYRLEFHQGIMKDITGQYAGLTVSEARDAVTRNLLASGSATSMYELQNGPIYCRCGGEVIVKIFEDQWFINYGDPEWKVSAHQCLNQMTIIPTELEAEFHNVVDWLHEKACARRHGMGTPLPWDPDWIIESLSDSVIYMSYYTIAHIINREQLSQNQVNDAMFDYIFLGRGNPDQLEQQLALNEGVLQEMRREFTYFYPLDSRNSGRDLVPNHLTFFIFNHVAIFPPSLWPQQIVVNGSVLMDGKKMSKSFGNIIPLRTALATYGADPLRIAILSTAELLQDADFSMELAQSMKERLERFYTFALDIITTQLPHPQSPSTSLDQWILGRLHSHIHIATEAMEQLRFRHAVQTALYLLDRDLQWYLRRLPPEQKNSPRVNSLLSQVIETKTLLLAPFTPHICEELWQQMGKPGFISTAQWPNYDASKLNPLILMRENMIQALLDDIHHIIQATKIHPTHIYLYTAASWKSQIYHNALRFTIQDTLTIRQLMQKALQNPENRQRAKQVSTFVQKLVTDMQKIAPQLLRERNQIGVISEYDIFSEAADFFAREFRAEVTVFHEEDNDVVDPQHRAHLAEPYRPAIYIE
ncbi:MAG: leucine--tRNA ligase [Candidatus Bathyarchaeota archaeon]|nr:leucine--tRNA ligase [Candidatus Bathyarchaeota archaeon]